VSAMIAVAKCECGAQVGPTEIERRLNAVEMLSAEDARMAADSIGEGWAESPDILRAYASVLEGETTDE